MILSSQMKARSKLQPEVYHPFSLSLIIYLIVLAGEAFSPRCDRAGVPVTNDNAQALLPPRACIFVAK